MLWAWFLSRVRYWRLVPHNAKQPTVGEGLELGVYPTWGTCTATKAVQSQRQRHETAPAARCAERGRCQERTQLTVHSLVRILRSQQMPLDSVVLVLYPSLLHRRQHGQNLPLRGEAGMQSIMGPFQRVVVSAFEGIITARAERGNHSLA
jgi:hypothetical protein